MKALGGVGFTHSMQYQTIVFSAVVQVGYVKTCQVVKKYFFNIKLLHAYLQYVCNIHMYLQSVEKMQWKL